MESLVNVTGLTKAFSLGRGRALVAAEDVSFDIQQGEVLGLIGESGSGKSTVARCIAGLLHPDSGRIAWATKGQPRIGMVFQDPRQSLNPTYRVWEAIADPLYLRRERHRGTVIDRVKWASNMVGLSGTELMAFPRDLADEAVQRASLARALIVDPDLLIMDEPTSALDSAGRASLLQLVSELCGQGLTALMISHDLTAVRKICERVCIMYLGLMMEVAETGPLFQSPAHPYTHALLASALDFAPDVPLPPLELVGEIPSPMERPRGCPLAPRCAWRVEECSAERPSLRSVGPARRAACIRTEEIDFTEATTRIRATRSAEGANAKPVRDGGSIQSDSLGL